MYLSLGPGRGQASVVASWEDCADALEPNGCSSVPYPPCHPPGPGLSAELPSETSLTEDDPIPWPNNVPQLPDHVSISSIVIEDPDPACPDTRVVRPPRDTLERLPILVHNIPASGTRSRAESSVPMTLDLVTIGHAASVCERVGSYKWLLLPNGTTIKTLDEEEMMQIPPDDILRLSVAVQCGSKPCNPVKVCDKCQVREHKRIEKERKMPCGRNATTAADKRKNRCESSPRNSASPVAFGGKPLRDFADGRVRLQTRVTCYCSHHKEREGFRLTFTMADSSGRVVGRGSTPPILITDDHKKTKRKRENDPSTDLNEAGESMEPMPKRHRPSLEVSISTTAGPSFTPSHSPPSPPSYFSETNYNAASLLPPQSDHYVPDTSPRNFVADEVLTRMDPLSVMRQGLVPETLTVDDATTESGLNHLIPRIESIAPISGSILGGTWINVIGTDFRPDHKILFGGIHAQETIYRSKTAMRCLSPPSAEAVPVPVPITVLGAPLIVGGGVGDAQLPMYAYEDAVEHELVILAMRCIGQGLRLSDQSPTAVARAIIANPQYFSR